MPFNKNLCNMKNPKVFNYLYTIKKMNFIIIINLEYIEILTLKFKNKILFVPVYILE